jgi:hypothetical protein
MQVVSGTLRKDEAVVAHARLENRAENLQQQLSGRAR